MGDNSQSTDVWPLPKYYFQVKWDAEVLSFQEVSGLDAEVQPIEYRSGDSPVLYSKNAWYTKGQHCDSE